VSAPSWRTALEEWGGVLLPAAAWATNLEVQYALTKWSCHSARPMALVIFTACALALVGLAGEVSWTVLKRTSHDAPTDGGRPGERSRFMAILGLTSSAFFALAIIAMAIPIWVLDACQ